MNNETFLDKSASLFDWLGTIPEIKNPFECMIAGGAPRDYVLEKEISDIDLIIPHAAVGLTGICPDGALDDLMRPHLESRGFTHAKPKYAVSKLGQPVKVYKHYADPIDIMLVPWNAANHYILDTFDVGLCMTMLDLRGNIFAHPLFFEEVANKCLTLRVRPTLKASQISRSVNEHIPRMLTKYTDFTVSIDYNGGLLKNSWSAIG